MNETLRTDNAEYINIRFARELERDLMRAMKERDEWKAKAEANARDAGRYRYLRDKEDGDMFMENVGEDLDRAIDAARSSEKEKE